MLKCRFALGLILSFLLPQVFSFASASQKIALDIFLSDQVAFRSQHAYYMKDVFARLFPDIEYRQIVVSNSLIGFNKQATRQEIQKELQTVLKPNEQIQFLILDTHGNTVESQGRLVTTLGTLGQVGPDGVDGNFDEIFRPIQNRAAPDLTILMNSCSTFCGPPEESQKRAQAFLDYFSAPHGRIYGAYVKEVDNIYLDPKNLKLKALLPSWKIYLTTVALFGAAIGVSPLLEGNFQTLDILRATLHGAVYFGLPFATLIEIVNPLFSWFAGKTFANRGWLFSFQNGKLQSQIDVQKPRDMELILKGNIRSCSRIHL
jgi:hypothetical protein